MGFQIQHIKPNSLLEFKVKEFNRLGHDLQAYEMLQSAGVYAGLTRKYEQLVRRHRQHVFDERAGDAHHRAILRLQKTVTSKAMAFDRWATRQERIGRELSGMGY